MGQRRDSICRLVLVESGGSAVDFTILSGGLLVISSGGYADPGTLSGGTEIISAGGSDDGTQISSGTQYVYGTATNATIFVGSQVVESGGFASSTTLSGGSEVVGAGGIDLGAEVSGGEQDVFAYASGATVFTGSQVIKSGGTAVVHLYLAVACSLSFPAGSPIRPRSSAAATRSSAPAAPTWRADQRRRAGRLRRSRAAPRYFTGSQMVESGGTASGTTVSSGGTLDVLSGGTASNASLPGGTLVIGGTLFGLRVSSGSIVEVSRRGHQHYRAERRHARIVPRHHAVRGHRSVQAGLSKSAPAKRCPAIE